MIPAGFRRALILALSAAVPPAGGCLLAQQPGAPAVADTSLGDSASADTTRADTTRADTTWKSDTSKTGASNADTSKTDASKAAAVDASRPDTSLVIDRVVAVVGNRPVLASQVDEEIFSRQSQGQKVPTDSAAIKGLREQVVQSIVDEELLVQQAQRDTTITVTDQEIADGVDQQVRKVRTNFTSEVDYRTELKKAGFQTPEEYRRWLTDQQRRAAFQNRLVEKLRNDGKLKPVPPTDAEMKVYFEEQKTTLGSRPATVSFRQIVVTPQPSSEAKVAARAKADSILLELRRGADFAVAAKRFSQDPGSKDQGGSLNWFRRGVMVPEFERVAFSLKPGVVSDPVESPFGFHLIQVERVQAGEVQARHILIVPDIDSAHVDSARVRAAMIRARLLAGASFDSLQRLYHDPSAEKQAENVPADKLPENYGKIIGKSDSGVVSPVFTIPGNTGRDQFVVVQVIGRRPEGDIRFEDVKDRIREQLGQQLAIRRYLQRLRQSTYVDVRS